MRLILLNREKLQALGAALVAEFDNLIARIRASWNVEHNEDGTHKNISAESIETGRVVYTGIVTEKLTMSLYHNFYPAFLDDASILRLMPVVDGALISGIEAPRHPETGAILDGRVLILENVSEGLYYFRLAHDLSPEGQGSLARNRFQLPRQPGVTNASSEFVVYPSTFLTLIYNAPKAKWVVQAQHLDQSIAFYPLAASENDIVLNGNIRPIRTWRIVPSLPDLSIGGFDSTQVPDDERKVVVNDGNYTVAFLHAAGWNLPTSRIYCPGEVRYLLHPRESVELQRSRKGGWRIISKADQWIDVPYSTGNFLSSPGTWTVPAGSVTTFMYQLDGNKMVISYMFGNTTVAGNPTALMVRIPDFRVSARAIWQTLALAYDGSTVARDAVCVANVNSQLLTFYKDGGGATPWAGPTVSLYGQIIIKLHEDYSMIEIHNDVGHADAEHADAEHGDIAHVDGAHVDAHADTPHGDGSHADLSHTDLHSDAIHTDSHTDSPHSDGHTDVAHVDVAHTDVGHLDEPHEDSHGDSGHTDWHNDYHEDQHGDVPAHSDGHEDLHYDWHYDVPPAWSHDDYHGDSGAQWPHTDTHGDYPHEDNHGDTPHADQPHADEAHEDAPSAYVPHSDVPHTDGHSDALHSDSHVDTPHYDSHSDVPHTDASHTDAAHTDGHSDTPHSDQIHGDQGHNDVPHGDSAHQDQGLHNDAAHTDI